MAEPATLRQLEVLRLIARGIEQGLPPTVRELCEALGVKSTNAVSDNLCALIKKGLLTKLPRRARALRLTFAGRIEAARAAA